MSPRTVSLDASASLWGGVKNFRGSFLERGLSNLLDEAGEPSVEVQNQQRHWGHGGIGIGGMLAGGAAAAVAAAYGALHLMPGGQHGGYNARYGVAIPYLEDFLDMADMLGLAMDMASTASSRAMETSRMVNMTSTTGASSRSGSECV